MKVAPGRAAGFSAATVLPSLLLSLAFLVTVGCGTTKPPVVDFSSVPRTYRSEDYPIVYERWTRHQKVVRETESVLEIWATFKSGDYREAFVAHYADAYFLNPTDRDHLLQAQREAAVGPYEFLVTAQSSNYRWNDLEKKSSPWRLSLVDGAGHAIVPDEVKVEKLPEMFEREFFPVRTAFTKTYLIRFARAPQGEEFLGDRSGIIKLRVAGPLGHAELVWLARGAQSSQDGANE